MTYFVRYEAYSRKFNESYIANQYTKDIESFKRNHKVVEAYECKVGKFNRIIEIGKKVIG